MNTEAALQQSPDFSHEKISITPYFIRHASKLFYLIIFLILFYGWSQKEYSNLSPESGLGYTLGIVGGSLMLLLLLYPLRKKIRFMHSFGLVKYWFKMHMLFGVLGPVAILYHANFGLGSVNGNIALFSMITVASSGLVGRYLYAKIHHGLYGRKASLQELRDSLMISKGQLGHNFKLSKTAIKLIKNAEKRALKKRNLILATLIWPVINIRTGWTKYRLKKIFKKDFSNSISVKKNDKKIIKALTIKASAEINTYLDSLYNIFGFKLFEGLFSLWHVLHLPLFFMLVVSGILHVVVVHSY